MFYVVHLSETDRDIEAQACIDEKKVKEYINQNGLTEGQLHYEM